MVKWGESGVVSLLTGKKIDEFLFQVRTTDCEQLKDKKRAAPNIIRQPSSKNVGLYTFVTMGNKLRPQIIFSNPEDREMQMGI